MKYFINNENRKVRLACVAPALDVKYAICWDLDGREYKLPMSEIFDDGNKELLKFQYRLNFLMVLFPLKHLITNVVCGVRSIVLKKMLRTIVATNITKKKTVAL